VADAKLKTAYVQQEQHPGGWVGDAETDDATAPARCKVFATGNPRATRLIKRTARVLSEGTPKPEQSKKGAKPKGYPVMDATTTPAKCDGLPPT
jgi:hypothetical protein